MSVKSQQFETVHNLPKSDVLPGDRIIVETRNSEYHLQVLSDNLFAITGGWFGEDEPSRLSIVYCTRTDSFINTELIAGVGMQIRFSNDLSTSQVVRIRVLRTMSHQLGGSSTSC